MSPFAAEVFFSLDRFTHRTLWKDGEAVWMALHRLKEYLDGQTVFEKKIAIDSSVRIEHPEMVSIGEGAILEPGVFIQGPCILGKRCHIRHGAFLRGGVICGDDCVIGHATEIKHSILLDGAQAAHLNYVGDSIVGAGANLGAGVKCANLRLDRKEISVWHEGEKFNTGLRKFGSILGDGCQIGCNCVLNPGTILGRECTCLPLVSVHGSIPAHSRIRGKAHEIDCSAMESARG